MSYTFEMIFHYLKVSRRKYTLLAVQLTLIFALLFMLKSAAIAVEEKFEAVDEVEMTFIVNFASDSDKELITSVITQFVDDHPDAEFDIINLSTAIILRSARDVLPLYDSFKELVKGCGENTDVLHYDTYDELDRESAGIENLSEILRVIALILTCVAVIGFVGYVMLTLLSREHDMLAAYLCGASMKRLFVMTGLEIVTVGIMSIIAGSILGALLSPVMSLIATYGRFPTPPRLEAFADIVVVCFVIYIIPMSVFAVRMLSRDPIVSIREEEN